MAKPKHPTAQEHRPSALQGAMPCVLSLLSLLWAKAFFHLDQLTD